MPSVQSGSHTCVIDTPATVTTTINTAGTYVVKLDLSNLAAGDVLKVLVKGKCRAADAASVAFINARFANAQTKPLVQSIPLIIDTNEALDVVLEQTDGTGRAISWNVLSV